MHVLLIAETSSPFTQAQLDRKDHLPFCSGIFFDDVESLRKERKRWQYEWWNQLTSLKDVELRGPQVPACMIATWGEKDIFNLGTHCSSDDDVWTRETHKLTINILSISICWRYSTKFNWSPRHDISQRVCDLLMLMMMTTMRYVLQLPSFGWLQSAIMSMSFCPTPVVIYWLHKCERENALLCCKICG